MPPEEKCAALRQLAKKRRSSSIQGYCRLSDFHRGYYECCFVSPWTKSAHNVDADVMLLGQDWSSSDRLSRSPDTEQKRLGQIWKLRANVNLRDLLWQNMKLEFRQTYATNVFPFIKKGPMNARIKHVDMQFCAREYAIPQIEIISPKMVICLGQSTFRAVLRSIGGELNLFKDAYQPEHCIKYRGIEIYGVPHPGNFGVRNAGGIVRVHERWQVLADRLMELRGTRRDDAEKVKDSKRAV